MRFGKKENYFVSITEFKEINRNPLMAGILSMFLGMFGIHRFYLKRKLTGAIFCVLSVSSLEFGNVYIASILMLISFIEGIFYIIESMVLLKNKYINNNEDKYAEKLKNSIDKEKNKVNVKIKEKAIEVTNKKESDEMGIIEVSDIEPVKIPKENVFNNTNNWIEKLDLPYERNIIKVVQVKEETISFYKKLCDFIDGELRKNKSSLNREVKRIGEQGGYYNNILYTIYCISEGHVTKTYSRNYYYNPEYSYRILEKHLGKNLKAEVFAKAQELEKYVSPPKGDTLTYFNLVGKRLPRVWWDMDGKLRNTREFSRKELNVLNVTPSRTTIVWDIREAKKQIIILYLEIWRIISNGLKKNLKWEKNSKETLQDIIDGKYIYFADYENGKILSSLIKISENVIREVIPNIKTLNTGNEQDNIEKYFPKEIVNDINKKIIEYKTSINDEKLMKILGDMIKKNPGDWKLKAEEILTAETDKRVSILIDYKEDENFIKIAKEIIKKADDENLLLLCLYGIEREEKLSQKNIKLLKNIIHPGNTSVYENILQSKEVLSPELFNRLVELKKPIRKKIELDMDKVDKSKRELNETVEIVEKYIGDEEEKEESQEDNFKEKIRETEYDYKLTFKYRDFLNLILNKGPMKIEEGKKIAMDNGTLLNAFISDVNRELYEYIQDQVIVIEDNYIKIDDFYVDMIKELIMSEAKSKSKGS